MKVAIWDTYVKRNDGKTMHFDILVPEHIKEESTVLNFGMDYLKTKTCTTLQLSTNECRFCHIEQATQKMIASIKSKGYFIIEMENCN